MKGWYVGSIPCFNLFPSDWHVETILNMINWLMHRDKLFVGWKLSGMLQITKFTCAQYCETEDDACVKMDFQLAQQGTMLCTL